jgi:hypothetical protein
MYSFRKKTLYCTLFQVINCSTQLQRASSNKWFSCTKIRHRLNLHLEATWPSGPRRWNQAYIIQSERAWVRIPLLSWFTFSMCYGNLKLVIPIRGLYRWSSINVVTTTVQIRFFLESINLFQYGCNLFTCCCVRLSCVKVEHCDKVANDYFIHPLHDSDDEWIVFVASLILIIWKPRRILCTSINDWKYWWQVNWRVA